MLLRFVATNFRSLREEQELSLIASSLKGGEGFTRVPSLAEPVLRVAAIYGANASGKSNVLLALEFMADAVRESQTTWKPAQTIRRQPFKLDGSSREKASSFEVEVLVGGVRLQYGFTVDSKAVRSEWCYAYPKGKRQMWFDRDQSTFRFGKNFAGENKLIERVTRSNSLFLSAAAQNNHAQLSPLYTWFATGLIFVIGERYGLTPETLNFCSDSKKKARVESFLKSADLGLAGIELKERQLDERTRKLFTVLRDAVPSALADSGGTDLFKLELPDTLPEIEFLHLCEHQKTVRLPMNSESDGTLALFALLGPIFGVLDAGGTLCVDELGASLHPLLALQIVHLFNSDEHNRSGAQLVFNTHDTNLLDPDVLRRDQIWFTEKDLCGATQLYPLTDFATRPDENLRHGYLQGRYGAIPFLGSKQLVVKPDRAAKDNGA